MRNLIKKYKNSILYFLSVFFSTSTILYFYNYKISFKKINLNPGLMNSESFENDGIICQAGSKNIFCMEQIFNDYKFNKKNILFFGNSQSGAVNNFRKSDISYISSIEKQISKRNQDLQIRGIWFPNANLVEFDKLNNLLIACNINIELLIIPVFLDDMRDQNIREEIASYDESKCFSRNPLTINKEYGNLLKANYKLKEKIFIFSYLKNLNSHFRIYVYKLRNLIFNIKPESVRNIRRASYNINIDALSNILENRTNSSKRTLVYIPPLLHSKSEKAIPYDYEEYDKFKIQIANLCNNYKCKFYNFESIVSDELWGLKSSTSLISEEDEIDYKHFTGAGHQIMSDKFLKILSEYFYLD